MRWWCIISLFLLLFVAGCQNTPAAQSETSTTSNNPVDPYVRLGKLGTGLESRLATQYHWESGILYAATVSVVVENRGGAGSINVIFTVENEEVLRETTYLESGETKEMSATLSLSKYRYTSVQQLKVNVKAIAAD